MSGRKNREKEEHAGSRRRSERYYISEACGRSLGLSGGKRFPKHRGSNI